MITLELRTRRRGCDPVPVRMIPAAYGRLQCLLRDFIRSIEREAELRRAEHILKAMPDAMLKDIGLSRGAIRNRVRGLPD